MRVHYSCLAHVPNHVVRAYDAGRYVFKVPPVCTRQWTRLDWINYVDFDEEVLHEYEQQEQSIMASVVRDV